jgi:hypothetical protein
LAKNGYHVEANLADSNDVLFSYTLRSTSTGDTRKMKACWHNVYLALPMSARDILYLAHSNLINAREAT